MSDLPSWAGTALDVFLYAFIIPGLVVYAVLCIVLLISPAVFAFWGNAPLSKRIWIGLGFCLMVLFLALEFLLRP